MSASTHPKALPTRPAVFGTFVLMVLISLAGLSSSALGAQKEDGARAGAHRGVYAKMSSRLEALARAGDSEMVDVIISYRDGRKSADIDRIHGLAGTVRREYGALRMRAATISANRLEELADDPSVAFVSRYSSMSRWKSRWSSDKFVNTAAAINYARERSWSSRRSR